MAAGGHLRNYFFYGLGYSVDQHIMLSRVFGVKEFIFDINFVIRPCYGYRLPKMAAIRHSLGYLITERAFLFFRCTFLHAIGSTALNLNQLKIPSAMW